MSVDNLWGDIPPVTEIVAPVSILKEQANFLGETTSGRLRGEVIVNTTLQSLGMALLGSTDKPRPTPDLRASLDIIAPTLNSYRYRVLTIQHGISFYPVTITTDQIFMLPTACKDEAAFRVGLAGVLKSDQVRNVIASLLSQIHALQP